jgi:hypothetical protein
MYSRRKYTKYFVNPIKYYAAMVWAWTRLRERAEQAGLGAESVARSWGLWTAHPIDLRRFFGVRHVSGMLTFSGHINIFESVVAQLLIQFENRHLRLLSPPSR